MCLSYQNTCLTSMLLMLLQQNTTCVFLLHRRQRDWSMLLLQLVCV